MAVKIRMLDPSTRESYWSTTRNELRSVRRTGDELIFAGAALLLITLALNRDKLDQLGFWLVVSAVLLGIISMAVWWVALRRRRIAAARGLVCDHCSYVPHDTEIEDLAELRRCPRCNGEL